MRGELEFGSPAVFHFASPLFHFSSTFFFSFPFSNPQSASIQPEKLSKNGKFVSYISLLSVLYPCSMCCKVRNRQRFSGFIFALLITNTTDILCNR